MGSNELFALLRHVISSREILDQITGSKRVFSMQKIMGDWATYLYEYLQDALKDKLRFQRVGPAMVVHDRDTNRSSRLIKKYNDPKARDRKKKKAQGLHRRAKQAKSSMDEEEEEEGSAEVEEGVVIDDESLSRLLGISTDAEDLNKHLDISVEFLAEFDNVPDRDIILYNLPY